MSIKLKLEGFEELTGLIQMARGDLDAAVESCMKQSAQTMQTELKEQMKAAGVESDLIERMPQFTISKEGNEIEAQVGYKKGSYDPNNPSDGYKVVFLNYGTPHRQKHGKVTALGFITEAKKSANKKIKKQQKEVLNKILSRLQK